MATAFAVPGAAGTARGLVLVVEDEPSISELIRMHLHRAGYAVHIERDGGAALVAIRTLRPSAIVLDVGLPGIDGIEVCRVLRQRSDWTPVLFVTARDDEVDRIVGLELGADDYITKPFSPRELVARVSTVLRRARPGALQSNRLTVGALTLDPDRRLVESGSHSIALTPVEFDLLAFLMARPGWVFRREQLLSEVWGYASPAGTRTVDVHVAQVRAKIDGAARIRTVRGVGYSIEAAGSPAPTPPTPTPLSNAEPPAPP